MSISGLWIQQLFVGEVCTCPSITVPHEKAMNASQLAVPTLQRMIFDGS